MTTLYRHCQHCFNTKPYDKYKYHPWCVRLERNQARWLRKMSLLPLAEALAIDRDIAASKLKRAQKARQEEANRKVRLARRARRNTTPEQADLLLQQYLASRGTFTVDRKIIRRAWRERARLYAMDKDKIAYRNGWSVAA